MYTLPDIVGKGGCASPSCLQVLACKFNFLTVVPFASAKIINTQPIYVKNIVIGIYAGFSANAVSIMHCNLVQVRLCNDRNMVSLMTKLTA